MLAPNALDAICWPRVPSAAVTSLVVVVFPLVPVTRMTCRPRASRESRSGFSRRPMTPPITDPSPRPASRDARLLVLISGPMLSGYGPVPGWPDEHRRGQDRRLRQSRRGGGGPRLGAGRLSPDRQLTGSLPAPESGGGSAGGARPARRR